MPRPRLELPPLTPSRDWKRRVQAFVAALPEDQGPYGVEIRPRRMTKTARQQGYYFGVIVKAFADYMRGHGARLPPIFKSFEDFAHRAIKERCLNEPVVDAEGQPILNHRGEMIHLTGSVADLDVEGMTRLIDAARTYLDDEFGIVTPEPDPLHGLSPVGGTRL